MPSSRRRIPTCRTMTATARRPLWPAALGLPTTQRSQTGLLHLPRVMRHGESYLIVLVTGRKTGIGTLRSIGDSVLGGAASWDTVRVPLADRVEVSASRQLFEITPVRPEERRGLLHSEMPELWVWEVRPRYRGRLHLFIDGSAWTDTSRFWFDLAHVRVEVRGSWPTRFFAFMETTVGQVIATAIVVPAGGWLFKEWVVEPRRRRRRRAAGFGR